MIFFAVSAAAVGMLHTVLSPGHWLPVALMGKTRRWSRGTSVLASSVAASGHALSSALVAGALLWAGEHLFHQYEETIESATSWVLIVFGLIYAAQAWLRHSSCHGHSHHGPEYEDRRGPFLFLFSLGLAPCVAVFPVFAAAATRGRLTIGASMIGFGLGVFAAFISTTLLASFGIKRLDHPFLEHHGDVITGLAVVAMGLLLPFIPHPGH